MRIFFTYIALSLTFIAFSQNVDFKKKNFNSPEDYKTAVEALEAGDDAFFVGDFEKALPKFKNAQKLNPNNATLNFKIGACYLKIDEIERSMPYFEKAKELDPKVDPKIDFALAQSYQANDEYQKAVDSYNTYLAGLSKNKKLLEEEKVQKELDICNTELQKIASKEEEAKEAAAKEAESAEHIVETKTEIVEKAPEEEKPAKTIQAPAKANTVEKTEKELKKTPVVQAAPKASSSEKITYRIQISSTASPASKDDLAKIYSGPLKISHQKIGQVYKYFIGDFTTKNEALKAKSLSGITDAFIVKFKNGVKF